MISREKKFVCDSEEERKREIEREIVERILRLICGINLTGLDCRHGVVKET